MSRWLILIYRFINYSNFPGFDNAVILRDIEFYATKVINLYEFTLIEDRFEHRVFEKGVVDLFLSTSTRWCVNICFRKTCVIGNKPWFIIKMLFGVFCTFSIVFIPWTISFTQPAAVKTVFIIVLATILFHVIGTS